MANICNAISKILHEKERFCRLCFNTVDNDSFSLQDSIFLSKSNPINVMSMLSYVLDSHYVENMSYNEMICQECFKSLKASYNFIKTSKVNLDLLTNVVDCLEKCFEDTVEDLDPFNSLFVSANTKDFSSKQYYDSHRSVNNKRIALARYKYLAFGKDVQRKSIKKVKTSKCHRYGEETFQLCNIILEDNRSKYQCKVCNMIFSKSFNMKKHYFSRHSDKRYQCLECDRSYGSETLLKQHKYDSHINIKCTVCGKNYKNRYSLLYHMRTHTGEKPYECEYCGKSFHWASRRAEHIRQLHLEANVSCNICQIKFRTLASLYIHRKRHFDPNSKYYSVETQQEVGQEAS